MCVCVCGGGGGGGVWGIYEDPSFLSMVTLASVYQSKTSIFTMYISTDFLWRLFDSFSLLAEYTISVLLVARTHGLSWLPKPPLTESMCGSRRGGGGLRTP